MTPKSPHYGLDLAHESRIQPERIATLLLIAALVIFALWLVGASLKGSDIERHIRVNTGKNHSPYSIIFIARIACQNVQFEFHPSQISRAQELLNRYFAALMEC